MPTPSQSSRPSIICILNDAAGPNAKQKPGDQVADLFAARDVRAQVWSARGGAELSELAQKAVAQQPDVVVAGGGDGTINCVAGALVGTRIALGVLPMGTLNHFAKDLGIPLGLEEAVETIVQGHTTRVDVGEVNERLFLNNSSLGLYPRLVRQRERLQGAGFSKTIAFLRAIGWVLFRYSHIHVRLDAKGAGTRSRATPFVFIGNNHYRTEGWMIGTRERMDAGELWLYIAPFKGPGELAAMAVSAVLGRTGANRVESFAASECWIETRRRAIDVATDGEVTRMLSPLLYRIRAGALRVIKPAAGPTGT